MCYSEPAFTQTAEVLRNSVSCMCISLGLMLAMLHFPYLGTFWCDTFIAFDGHNLTMWIKSSSHITSWKPFCQPAILTCSSVFSRFQLDHARSNLIWNLKTREELRDALEGEMRAFSVDRELGSATVISWNHQEFEVCAQLYYVALTSGSHNHQCLWYTGVLSQNSILGCFCESSREIQGYF